MNKYQFQLLANREIASRKTALRVKRINNILDKRRSLLEYYSEILCDLSALVLTDTKAYLMGIETREAYQAAFNSQWQKHCKFFSKYDSFLIENGE